MQKLYRSKKNRILAGVCGGLAEVYGWDPSMVRIITAILIIPGGLSVWAYVIAALVIPAEA